jgi:hypothetical protein
MSKYFALYLIDKNDYKSLLAVSDDLWLVELFVVQRNLKKRNTFISKCKMKDIPPFSDKMLIYYFGYSVTEFEYNYIVNNELEYESEIDRSIYTLESGLIMYDKFMSKKERKKTKEVIRILKKKKDTLSNNKEFAKIMLDNVIDRPGMVIDYMENLNTFRECMEG